MAIASIGNKTLKQDFLDQKYAIGFFSAANIGAGVFHYLYQVVASARLDTVTFGALNTWIAQVSVFFIFSSFVRFHANFVRVPVRKFALPLGLLFSFLFALVATLIILTPKAADLWIGCLVISLSIPTSWLLGQLQTRKLFLLLGLGILLVAVAKLAGVFALDMLLPSERAFYWAFPLGYFLPVFFILVALWKAHRKQEEFRFQRNHLPPWETIVGTLILSFTSVFLPQMDILSVDRTQTAEVIGQFARVSLFYKGVFFFVMVFSQVILPHQIEAGRQNKPIAPWRIVRSRMSLFLLSSALGAVAASFFVPPLARLIMNFDMAGFELWIGLASFNICLLTALFLLIQSLTSKGLNRQASWILLGIVIHFVTLPNFDLEVSVYLASVVSLNFLILLFGLHTYKKLTVGELHLPNTETESRRSQA